VNVALDVYAADRARLHKVMRSGGLQEVRFRFDFEGTKILAMGDRCAMIFKKLAAYV
jgi:hypothetical protein